jgi:hypothetical protein
MPDLDLRMSPVLRTRCWRLTNALAMGPESWGLPETDAFSFFVPDLPWQEAAAAKVGEAPVTVTPITGSGSVGSRPLSEQGAIKSEPRARKLPYSEENVALLQRGAAPPKAEPVPAPAAVAKQEPAANPDAGQQPKGGQLPDTLREDCRAGEERIDRDRGGESLGSAEAVGNGPPEERYAPTEKKEGKQDGAGETHIARSRWNA